MENLPTKKNLLDSKQNLALARKGHDLLDLKLCVLAARKKREQKAADELREILRGLYATHERACAVAERPFPPAMAAGSPPYKLHETCAAIDEAYLAHKEILAAEDRLAQIEKKLALIEERMRKAKKRTSALRNIVIPAQEARVKFISERLEENERDELIRLKSAKK